MTSKAVDSIRSAPNDAARHAKTRLLINAGFRVEEAADGAQALAMVAKLQPSLVLLDMKLPDVSGSEVCRQIKANPETSQVFVLQTSAALISRAEMRGMTAAPTIIFPRRSNRMH
jgi:CheY-like chemotaxis protein